MSFTLLHPTDFGCSSSKTGWSRLQLRYPFIVTAWSSLRLCVSFPGCFGSSLQFRLPAWMAAFSLYTGPFSSASRLRGSKVTQRHLSWLLCCLHKILFASLSVILNYPCPSVARSPQSVFLLRTSHLRKSISSISLCVFSNWPQSSIYIFPVEKSTTEIKSNQRIRLN